MRTGVASTRTERVGRSRLARRERSAGLRARTVRQPGPRLREHLGEEALTLTDPLDLDRDRVDRLLDPLQPRLDVRRLCGQRTKPRHLLAMAEVHSDDPRDRGKSEDDWHDYDFRIGHGGTCRMSDRPLNPSRGSYGIGQKKCRARASASRHAPPTLPVTPPAAAAMPARTR